MIPDTVIQKIYMSKEFIVIPCMFQSLALDAFEDAIKETNYRIVEVKKNATDDKS